tara:strand:+ start:129 stop:929 length:801 start_codon:yes stop_codon:yes gene_type:complete
MDDSQLAESTPGRDIQAAHRFWSGDVAARAFVLALVFACATLAAGALASLFEYATLQPGALRFSAYANPFTLDWGIVHWISLAPTLWLSYRMLGAPLEFVRTAQLAFLIIAFGVLLMDFDLLTLRFRHIPFLLFWGVDAGLLVVLTIVLRPSAPVARASVGALGFFIAISTWGLVRDPPLQFEVLRVDESLRGTQYVVVADSPLDDCIAARELLAEISVSARETEAGTPLLRPSSMLILVRAAPELHQVYILAGEVTQTRQCIWHG